MIKRVLKNGLLKNRVVYATHFWKNDASQTLYRISLKTLCLSFPILMSFFQYQYRTEKFYFSWPVFMRCLFWVGSGPKSEFRVLNRFTQETPLAWSLCAHFLVWSSKIRKSNENCGTCLTDETVALRIFGSTFRQKSAPMSYVSHWTLEHCYISPHWSSVISCIAVSSKPFWNSIASYLL